MYRCWLAYTLSVSLLLSTSGFGAVETSAQTPPAKAATSDQQAMDKLLAPIALYPDALLAQVLACASSPQQVTEVNKWLQQNSQLKGADLQAAAEKAGFDAGFIALVVFPDVLKMLETNLPWATELGKAFTSDQKAALASVQRLRAQAKAAGNLKTTPQQEVKTETQNGQTVIVIQPANPQVVYVPVYNTQTVYVAAPPAPDNSANVAAAAVIGFGLGIALGAAMSNNSYGYYGYSAWGMHWHSSVVVVHGGAWHYPPGGRYAYARPVSGYHPNTNVYAPHNSNVNVNVNNSTNVNVNKQNVNNANVNKQNVNNANKSTNSYNQTPRPTTTSGTTSATRGASTQPSTAAKSNTASRGYSGGSPSTAAHTASPAGQMQTGKSTSAFSGYQNGSSAKASSTRGRSSASSGGRHRR
jgi:Protein of unknown function (DUF3300)